MESFVKDGESGWSAIPHGLWVAPGLTHGQRCLLGWLHSHAESYLAKLSRNRCEKEFGGGGSTKKWIDALETKGYLTTVEVEGATRITLHAAPWAALGVRKPGGAESAPGADLAPGGGRIGPVGGADLAPIEDHLLEDHLEHQSRAPVVVTYPFDAFWNIYPRKASRAEAVKRWNRLTDKDRCAVMAALPNHVVVWRAQKRGVDTIPHASTWLNQRRWEDDLRGETQVAPSAGDNPFLTMLREGNHDDP